MSTPEKRKDVSALDVMSLAQELAFSPIVFQGLRCLWKLGVLKAVEDAGQDGADVETLVRETGLSDYAVGVLVSVGESAGALLENKGRYKLSKVGFFLLHDEMTHVNMNFTHDTCYQAAFHLEESLKTGKPEGLKIFGDYNTVYEALSELPPKAKKSWFEFDHYYSDRSFKDALEQVFNAKPKNVMDIGGNTGRWTIQCLEHDPDVTVTIVDLPGQLAVAKEEIKKAGLEDRVRFHEANLLDPESPLPKGPLPKGMDVVWMSQFLDCFSEDEIFQILTRVQASLNPGGRVFILELFIDRQKYQAATHSLNATSLYFTFLANGNSRMYGYEAFSRCVQKAGLEILSEFDDPSFWHTLLECKVAE